MKYDAVFRPQFSWQRVLGATVVVILLVGCTALREAANLRNVRFQIERVSETRLAGIDVSDLESFEDLSSRDMLRLGASLTDGSLPLSFVLHLRATNPSENDANARLTKMQWTLLLEETETVSGTYDGEVLLRPGAPTDVPVQIDLDLVRFFDENLREFIDLVSALSGEGPPQRVKLKIRPTITTRLGPIKYPSEITVVSRDVGGDGQQK